jgi:hypothetical protein
MKKFIHETMIRHWVGSDHDNKEAFIGLLVELLNDIYDVQELREDILDLWCEDDEEETV